VRCSTTSTTVASPVKPTGLVDLAEPHARARATAPGLERQPAEQRLQQRGLAAPFGPTSATRSP
jgi:hypothetical protein